MSHAEIAALVAKSEQLRAKGKVIRAQTAADYGITQSK